MFGPQVSARRVDGAVRLECRSCGDLRLLPQDDGREDPLNDFLARHRECALP